MTKLGQAAAWASIVAAVVAILMLIVAILPFLRDGEHPNGSDDERAHLVISPPQVGENMCVAAQDKTEVLTDRFMERCSGESLTFRHSGERNQVNPSILCRSSEDGAFLPASCEFEYLTGEGSEGPRYTIAVKPGFAFRMSKAANYDIKIECEEDATCTSTARHPRLDEQNAAGGVSEDMRAPSIVEEAQSVTIRTPSNLCQSIAWEILQLRDKGVCG